MAATDVMDKMYMITERGNIPILEIKPGDKIYEYYNCRQHTIEAVDAIEEELFMVEFTDGRVCWYDGAELDELLKTFNFTQKEVYYGEKFDLNTLDPDPYLAGPMLLFGDFTSEEVAIPVEIASIQPGFYDSNVKLTDVRYRAHRSVDGKTYRYSRTDDPSDTNIKWADLFKNYPSFNTNDGNVFPIEYERAWIKDRIRMVQGIFEFATNIKKYKDSITIEFPNKARLEYLQNLLLSLGLKSVVREISLGESENKTEYFVKSAIADVTELPESGGKVNIAISIDSREIAIDKKSYALTVLDLRLFPTLFHDIKNIDRVFDLSQYTLGFIPRSSFQFRVRSYKSVGVGISRKFYVSGGKRICYLANDFLPKFTDRK